MASNKADIVIGVDPGSISAAYAIVVRGPSRAAFVADMPVAAKMVQATAWAQTLREHLKPFGNVDAVVELVNAMPKQGVSSSFNFGKGCGMIEGVLAALEIRTHLVSPIRWKRALNLSSDADASRDLASRLYPDVAKFLTKKRDHNKAEALLLAHWFLSTQVGQNDV